MYLSRSAGKLDAALSYVGGLLGIVDAFLAFFINNYNNYTYDLMAA